MHAVCTRPSPIRLSPLSTLSTLPTCGCSIVILRVRGWPVPFLVVSKPIKCGEELLYSYGSGYWKFFWNLQVLRVKHN